MGDGFAFPPALPPDGEPPQALARPSPDRDAPVSAIPRKKPRLSNRVLLKLVLTPLSDTSIPFRTVRVGRTTTWRQHRLVYEL